MNLSLEDGAIFMQVMKQLANPWVCIMAASAVLLAIISTASALLLALSSNVVQDTGFSSVNGRGITLALGLGAIFGPYIGSDIITWMVGSYEISVGALLIPILYAVYTKRKTLPNIAAWWAIALGSLGTGISWAFPGYTWIVFLPFGLSFIGFFYGELEYRRGVVVEA